MARSRRRDRILISAFVGSENLGDEAIFLSLAELLATRLPDSKLTVVSKNPMKTRRLLQTGNRKCVAQVRIRSRMWLPVAITTHDTCIFGGGGIIQDQSSLFNLVYFLLQIQAARWLRKKVVLAFVGVGPVRSRVGQVWTRVALSGLALCIVRDESSKRLLEKLGVSRTQIHCAADIALNLYCQAGGSCGSPRGYPYVLISLRHWYEQRRIFTPAFMKSGKVKAAGPLDALLNGLVRELSAVLDQNENLRIVATPLHGRRDEVVHRELFCRFEPRYRARLILTAPKVDPCEYLSLAESAVCIVAMRLHALILGSLRTAPLIALSYSPKVSSFMRQLELGESVLDIEWETDVGSLGDRVAAAVDHQCRGSYEVGKLLRCNIDAMNMLCRAIGGR